LLKANRSIASGKFFLLLDPHCCAPLLEQGRFARVVRWQEVVELVAEWALEPVLAHTLAYTVAAGTALEAPCNLVAEVRTVMMTEERKTEVSMKVVDKMGVGTTEVNMVGMIVLVNKVRAESHTKEAEEQDKEFVGVFRLPLVRVDRQDQPKQHLEMREF
jgi:hypothetical protein